MTGTYIKALMTGAGQAIKKLKPNVPKTRLEKADSKLKIAKHKAKMAGAKLKQTVFEIENPKVSKGKFTFGKDKKKTESKKEAYKRIQGENTEVIKGMLEKAAKGRKELKDGSKKSDFGAQSVKHGLDKNYGVTKADRIAKFVGKKNKKKII